MSRCFRAGGLVTRPGLRLRRHDHVGEVRLVVDPEQRRDLFPALLKTGPDHRLRRGREDKGRNPTPEIQEMRFDVGSRVKTGGGDLMAGREFESRLQEDRNRAERFRAGRRGVALGRFLHC